MGGKKRGILHNHITLWIQYHLVDTPKTISTYDQKARIIAVYVTASSFDTSQDAEWKDNCEKFWTQVSHFVTLPPMPHQEFPPLSVKPLRKRRN